MLRALLIGGVLLHHDAAADLGAVAARQLDLPGWGVIAVALLPRAVRAAAHPRPRRRRAGARPRRAVRLQSCLLGRHPGDRLARAGRLRRQERGARAGRWSASPRKLQRTVFVDRARRHQTGDAIARDRRAARPTAPRWCCSPKAPRATATACCRSARRWSARSSDAAERGGAGSIMIQPMSIAYTGQQGIPMGRQHRAARRLVRRSRLHAAHQDVHRARRGRCGGHASASRSPPTARPTARQ